MKGDSYGVWIEAGYPIVEGIPPKVEVLNATEPDPSLVSTMDSMFRDIPEGWGFITPEQLATELAENPEVILIDVRTPEELAEKGVIEADNVVAIQLEDFIAMKAKWPADQDATIVA